MKEVKEFLLKHQDLKYKDFSLELNIYHKYQCIGVRIPIIRNYAKYLSKKYSLDYLINNIDEEYYEEILLKGFIIGNYQSLSYEELTYYIDNYLPKIKDWSMCDTFAASLKITKKYQDKLWKYLLNKLKSRNEFIKRFSLVMILDYYINDAYKDKIYEIIKSIDDDRYYVKMANAWLISYMFINYFDDTIIFIKNNTLDNWTKRKGITKAIESFRINSDNKKVLRRIRDNINNKEKINDIKSMI